MSFRFRLPLYPDLIATLFNISGPHSYASWTLSGRSFPPITLQAGTSFFSPRRQLNFVFVLCRYWWICILQSFLSQNAWYFLRSDLNPLSCLYYRNLHSGYPTQMPCDKLITNHQWRPRILSPLRLRMPDILRVFRLKIVPFYHYYSTSVIQQLPSFGALPSAETSMTPLVNFLELHYLLGTIYCHSLYSMSRVRGNLGLITNQNLLLSVAKQIETQINMSVTNATIPSLNMAMLFLSYSKPQPKK